MHSSWQRLGASGSNEWHVGTSESIWENLGASGALGATTIHFHQKYTRNIQLVVSVLLSRVHRRACRELLISQQHFEQLIRSLEDLIAAALRVLQVRNFDQSSCLCTTWPQTRRATFLATDKVHFMSVSELGTHQKHAQRKTKTNSG